MLTDHELIRQVVKEMHIPDTTKASLLMKRAIKRGKVCTAREFRSLRRQLIPMIQNCAAQLSYLFSDASPKVHTRRDYMQRAPIDIIINEILNQKSLVTLDNPSPPQLRRTNTGFFGCSTTEEEVEFGYWE